MSTITKRLVLAGLLLLGALYATFMAVVVDDNQIVLLVIAIVLAVLATRFAWLALVERVRRDQKERLGGGKW